MVYTLCLFNKVIIINICLTHAIKPNRKLYLAKNPFSFIPFIFHFLKKKFTLNNGRHNHNNNHNCVITVIFISVSYSYWKYVSIYMEINIHTIISQCYTENPSYKYEEEQRDVYTTKYTKHFTVFPNLQYKHIHTINKFLLLMKPHETYCDNVRNNVNFFWAKAKMLYQNSCQLENVQKI